MSDITEIKGEVEKIGHAWSEFQKKNDERLALLEKGRGTADIDAQLAKMNETLDSAQKAMQAAIAEQKERADKLETALRRPSSNGRGELSSEASEHKAAFTAWFRKGIDGVKGGDEALRGLERKALSVGSDPDGGYLVPADTSGQIVRKIFDTSPIRQLASVQTISTDSLEGLTDLNDATASWVSETGTRSESSTPQIGKWSIPVHEMYSMPYATQKVLDDANIDVEAWLAAKTADKFARTEATAFVTGNGVGQPRGFASYTTAATADSTRAWGTMEHVATGSNGSFGTSPNGSDKLISLIHALKPSFRANARFLMNRGTLSAVRQLKTGTSYIWLPALDTSGVMGATLLPSGSLLGFPVVEAEDMAAYTGTGALAIAFGDFRAGYQVVDRMGIRVLRDPYSAKPYVAFYTTRRVGGDVVNFEAIKFLYMA